MNYVESLEKRTESQQETITSLLNKISYLYNENNKIFNRTAIFNREVNYLFLNNKKIKQVFCRNETKSNILKQIVRTSDLYRKKLKEIRIVTFKVCRDGSLREPYQIFLIPIENDLWNVRICLTKIKYDKLMIKLMGKLIPLDNITLTNAIDYFVKRND